MRINTNLNAMIATNQMSKNTALAGSSMEKLSTGLRITKAGDDAAGLAVSEKMRAQIRGMEQAERNVQDGISMVQTAEGALEEAGNIAQRMRELGVQAGNDTLSAEDRTKVKEELKDNTVVFAGPSGVGKSSLLNEIDKNFKLKTGDVSDKIKRGKHTTRHAELFELEFGGMVADTPGFSSLTLDDIEDVDLKDYFIEFDNYDDCKFGSRCIHQNEPNCAVKEAVENREIPKERYESYIQLLNEIRQGKRRY